LTYVLSEYNFYIFASVNIFMIVMHLLYMSRRRRLCLK
jgi:hypothetical protein